MATPKPPKPKPIKFDVPEINVEPDDTIDSYKSSYDPKPYGSIDLSGDSRASAIDELKHTKMNALDTKSKLLDQYNDHSTNWGDIIAETIMTLAPTIAGYALDKNKGLIYGTNIGLQAGQNYRQNRQQQKQLDRYVLGQQLENTDAQISGTDKLLQDYLEKEWGVQDREQEKSDDRAYSEQRYEKMRGDRLSDYAQQLNMRTELGGSGKPGAEFGVSDELLQEWADRSGKTVDEVKAMVPKSRADAYAAVQFGDFIGNRPKPVGQGAKDQIEAGLQSQYLLEQMEKDAALMASDPSIINAMKGGKLTDMYRVPGSPADRFYRNALQLQKQIARQNDGGRPTDKDFELLNPIVVGSPVLDSPESIAARIRDLKDYSAFKLKSVVGIEGATGRKVDKLENLINGGSTSSIGATTYNNPTDYGTGWVDRAEKNQIPIQSNVPLAKPSLQQFSGDKAAYLQALQNYNNQMRAQHGQ